MCRTKFWTLWEKASMGWFERSASKHVYCLGWDRSPAQAGCMKPVLGPGALGRPRGIRWSGKWEGGLRWGIHVNPWLIHVNVWQNLLQYCKVISLQLIKISGKKKSQRNQGSNCQHSLYHSERKGIPEKISTSLSLTMIKLLTVWMTTNCRKFLKRQEYRTTSPASWKPVCRSRSNS